MSVSAGLTLAMVLAAQSPETPVSCADWSGLSSPEREAFVVGFRMGFHAVARIMQHQLPEKAIFGGLLDAMARDVSTTTLNLHRVCASHPERAFTAAYVDTAERAGDFTPPTLERVRAYVDGRPVPSLKAYARLTNRERTVGRAKPVVATNCGDWLRLGSAERLALIDGMEPGARFAAGLVDKLHYADQLLGTLLGPPDVDRAKLLVFLEETCRERDVYLGHAFLDARARLEGWDAEQRKAARRAIGPQLPADSRR
jgi:hypothetical protein